MSLISGFRILELVWIFLSFYRISANWQFFYMLNNVFFILKIIKERCCVLYPCLFDVVSIPESFMFTILCNCSWNFKTNSNQVLWAGHKFNKSSFCNFVLFNSYTINSLSKVFTFFWNHLWFVLLCPVREDILRMTDSRHTTHSAFSFFLTMPYFSVLTSWKPGTIEWRLNESQFFHNGRWTWRNS